MPFVVDVRLGGATLRTTILRNNERRVLRILNEIDARVIDQQLLQAILGFLQICSALKPLGVIVGKFLEDFLRPKRFQRSSHRN